MKKHNHEHTLDQSQRFGAGQSRGRFVGAQVKQQLTLITILLTLAALLFVRIGDAWARPLLAVAPSLGTATSFAVLAGSTATNTGLTTVVGDLGVSPGTAITGFPPGVVTGGTIHANDAVALQAQNDVTAAYNNLAGQACNTTLTGQDLGGQTLPPGVYCFSTSAQLTGVLTLDGQGDPNAIFVFQIGSTLTTASNAAVLLINGASSCNVFWQIGSAATLGTDTVFVGSLLTSASITLNTNASLFGRALAQTGAVTMDTNQITTLCTPLLPTPTDTPVPSTSTSTPTPTPLTPIATDTSTPLATDTPVPLTSTLTPTPTPLTPIATATPTLLATSTATPTATNTPILLTSTPTPNNPQAPTPTLTATPDLTSTSTPTSTAGPPTGLDPINEPIAAAARLYLPFAVK